MKGKDFVIAPYTINLNDIVQFECYNLDTSGFEKQLSEEAAHKRRQMSISLHDHIACRLARIRLLKRFLEFAQKKLGVAFLRKDEIAGIALSSAITPRFESLYSYA